MLGEGRLALPGQVWDLKMLPLILQFPEKIAVQKRLQIDLEVPEIPLPDKRNPPKNKINNYFAQRTFSQRSPKDKQNEIVVLFMVVLFKRTRGPGEKKTQKMRKRRNKEKKTQSKNMQTRYEKKTKDKRKHKNKIGVSHRKKHKKRKKQEEDKTNNRKKKHGAQKKKEEREQDKKRRQKPREKKE